MTFKTSADSLIFVSDDATTRKRRIANQVLNRIGGLEPINMVLYMLLEKLNQVDRKLFLQEHQLEHELRMILNILMNFLVHNNDDPSVAQDFVNS